MHTDSTIGLKSEAIAGVKSVRTSICEWLAAFIIAFTWLGTVISFALMGAVIDIFEHSALTVEVFYLLCLLASSAVAKFLIVRNTIEVPRDLLEVTALDLPIFYETADLNIRAVVRQINGLPGVYAKIKQVVRDGVTAFLVTAHHKGHTALPPGGRFFITKKKPAFAKSLKICYIFATPTRSCFGGCGRSGICTYSSVGRASAS